jgi:hypothetical protein
MFNKQFFLKHQGKLLWLLNTPVVCLWFRYVLRIHGGGSSVGSNEIRGILPHVIFWYENGKRKAEFRTHAKFSKRLYYAFAPLWWTLHAWDWAFADRWVPELSFGFSTLTTYPDADPETNTVDGFVARDGVDEAFASIISGAGNTADSSSASNSMVRIQCSAITNQWASCRRSMFLYLTSGLTSSATISAAVLSVYGQGAYVDDVSGSPTLNIYSANPASNTALATSDYANCGTTPYLDTSVAYSAWSASAYNDYNLNAAGIAAVSKTGVSKFSMRNANYDVAATAPPWGSSGAMYFGGYWADQTGTANDPKLVVTYTIEETVPYVIAYVTRTDLFAGSSRT